jgi:hypothetical protein
MPGEGGGVERDEFGMVATEIMFKRRAIAHPHPFFKHFYRVFAMAVSRCWRIDYERRAGDVDGDVMVVYWEVVRPWPVGAAKGDEKGVAKGAKGEATGGKGKGVTKGVKGKGVAKGAKGEAKGGKGKGATKGGKGKGATKGGKGKVMSVARGKGKSKDKGKGMATTTAPPPPCEEEDDDEEEEEEEPSPSTHTSMMGSDSDLA